MTYISIFYGLAFFSLGIIVGLESFRPITPAVKPAFRSLALFGLLYALHQLFEHFNLMLAGEADVHSYPMLPVDLALLTVSTLFLARFGLLLISRRQAVTLGIPLLGLLVWALSLVYIQYIARTTGQFHLWAVDANRYLLMIPANLLAGWGILFGNVFDVDEGGWVRTDRAVLAGLFAANAGLSGLVVDASSFFPANFLNNRTFFSVIGVPVEFVRMIIAIGITIFMVRVLRVFEFIYVKNLGEKEVMEADARVAASIQAGLVPKRPLRIGNAEVHAKLLPARIVGGDVFDYFEKDGRMIFMVGDASGKGSSGAILCTAGLLAVESEAEAAGRPSDILRRANKNLAKRFPGGSFMTAMMGEYFSKDRLFDVANSGQNPPIMYVAGAGRWKVIDFPGSLPLGVDITAEPSKLRIPVNTGDKLLLYTDGLIDIRCVDGRRLGYSGVMKWLNNHTADAPAMLLENLATFLLKTSGGQQSDDVALLIVTIGGSARPGAHRVA